MAWTVAKLSDVCMEWNGITGQSKSISSFLGCKTEGGLGRTMANVDLDGPWQKVDLDGSG